jgi:hypothetical protein
MGGSIETRLRMTAKLNLAESRKTIVSIQAYIPFDYQVSDDFAI